jgi:hypothetical protein
MHAPLPNTLSSPYLLGPFELPNRLALSIDARIACRAWTGVMAGLVPGPVSRLGLLVADGLDVRSKSSAPCTPGRERSSLLGASAEAMRGVGTRAFLRVGRPRRELPRDLSAGMDAAEVRALVRGFADDACRAMDAGFDGVELDSSSGSLPMQFLSSETNRRQDRFGGSLCRRARFVLEVLEAIILEVGSERVGMRITPNFSPNMAGESDPAATYIYLARVASGFGLAFLHVEPSCDAPRNEPTTATVEPMRNHFRGTLITGGYPSLADAARAVELGRTDLVFAQGAGVLGVLTRDGGLSCNLG